MRTRTPSYHRYRFPPEIISHAVWLYHRFSLSFRDVEDLLAQRGVAVTYETNTASAIGRRELVVGVHRRVGGKLRRSVEAERSENAPALLEELRHLVARQNETIAVRAHAPDARERFAASR